MYFTKEEADGLVISFGCNGADLKPNEETLYRWAKEDIREKTENEYLTTRFGEPVEIFRYSFIEECGWLFRGEKTFDGDRCVFNVYDYDGKLMFKAFEKSFHYVKVYKYFKDSRMLVDIARII